MDEGALRQLELVSDLVDSLAERDTTRSRLEVYNGSELMAVRFVLREIAIRLGASRESFDLHFEACYSRAMDEMLRGVEKTSPSSASLLDVRSLEEIDTGEPLPPLFPQKDA